MKKLLLLPALLLATLANATVTAYSPPVGGITRSAAGTTDSVISVALSNPAAWVGTAAGVSGNDITVNGAPGWGTNTFASGTYYYVRMLTGVQKGHYFSIVSNGSSDLAVDNAGMDLSVIAGGDTIEIAPYWTLGTLYPASQAGISFTATTSLLSRQTLILFFDATVTGINRPSSASYYFYNGAWRKIGQPTTTSFNNTIVYPDTYFMQRNTAPATALTYTGRVQPGYLGTVLVGASATANDNYVSLAYPVDITLDQLTMAPSSFVATTSLLSTKDQLLYFSPTVTGINRPSDNTFYYYNGAWRRKGAATTLDVGPTTVLTAGSGFIIRKAVNDSTVPWVYTTGF